MQSGINKQKYIGVWYHSIAKEEKSSFILFSSGSRDYKPNDINFHLKTIVEWAVDV